MNKLSLNSSHIEAVKSLAQTFMENLNTEHGAMLRILISLEEILLNYQESFGPEQTVFFTCYTKLGQQRMELILPGPPSEPFREDENSLILRRLLSQMEIAPTWRYLKGENHVLFTVPKAQKKRQLTVPGALAFSLTLGLLFRFLAPDLGNTINEALLSPVLDAIMGLLSMISGPLIFFSIAWGVYGIGDLSTLNRIGKKMFSRFFLLLVGYSAMSMFLQLPMLSVTPGQGGALDLSSMGDLIFSIVPDNFLMPFQQENPMQIIFLSAIMGMALLVLGSKTSVAADLVGQCNQVAMLIIKWISGAIPLIIFCCSFDMALDIQIRQLMDLGGFALIHLVTTCLAALISFFSVVVKLKVKPLWLFQKLLPAAGIGLATASSSAALEKSMTQCRKELGIHGSLVNFGVPLGQVIFMPTAALQYVNVSIFLALMYEKPITPLFLFSTLLLSVMLSIAIPPIPGADITAFTLLFAQMGIAPSALAILLPVNMILDFTDTAISILCLQCELTQVANQCGLLNKSRLLSQPRAEKNPES